MGKHLGLPNLITSTNKHNNKKDKILPVDKEKTLIHNTGRKTYF
jgi:hypothetical protein